MELKRLSSVELVGLGVEEQSMSKYALYVPLKAKPGKEKDVADFLLSAVPLVKAEPATKRFPGSPFKRAPPHLLFLIRSTTRPDAMSILREKWRRR